MSDTKGDGGFWKDEYVTYIVYSVFIAMIFIVIYQLTQSHRIVLLQRESYAPTETSADATGDDVSQQSGDAAPEAS